MENTTRRHRHHHHLSPAEIEGDVVKEEALAMRSRGESREEESDNGREKLKRHRIEVAGRVWIPEIWGQEELLKDWVHCSAFDECLVPPGIMSARAALVEQGTRIENRC
ncbi:hypothetical protein V6N13_042876 [Hibiscus sabdariffa]